MHLRTCDSILKKKNGRWNDQRWRMTWRGTIGWMELKEKEAAPSGDHKSPIIVHRNSENRLADQLDQKSIYFVLIHLFLYIKLLPKISIKYIFLRRK